MSLQRPPPRAKGPDLSKVLEEGVPRLNVRVTAATRWGIKIAADSVRLSPKHLVLMLAACAGAEIDPADLPTDPRVRTQIEDLLRSRLVR